MKKYLIYPRLEAIKRSKKKNWGYIKQDDNGNILELFLKPIDEAFGRIIVEKLQKKLIKFLKRMDFVIVKTYKNRKKKCQANT